VIDLAHQWDPTSGISWAKLLGMVHVPMFSGQKPRKAAKEASIILDGYRGSFAFLNTEDTNFAIDTTDPLSWSWSSCVRHTVTVLPNTDRLYVRRWDDPHTIRKFEMPSQGIGAFSLLTELEKAAEPRRPNVVRHVLEPFRQIRLRIGVEDSLLAIKFLNGLLLLAELAHKRDGRSNINSIKTFGEAFNLLSKKNRELCGLMNIPGKIANLDARDLVRDVVDPDPYTGCELHPGLLFRHAASKLYQEAHLEIERNPQGYFLGLEPTHAPVKKTSPRDVRFTPPNLARALVQKALEAMSDQKRDLTILDPACGSGVFLVEAIRELTANDVIYRRKIKAVGYDISDISEYTTRFCLEHATHHTNDSRTLQTEVIKCDSLDHPWVSADVILMNPPFIQWERMSLDQQQKVIDELGDTARQRPDISMAFVNKAVRSLKPGGVLGCVLPAALLTGQTGIQWRERLSEHGNIRVIGCFEGYKYFTTSLVETAFLIYQKHGGEKNNTGIVEVLVAYEGYEDAGLRALRLESEDVLHIKGVEHFERPLQTFRPENWRPSRQFVYREKNRITNLGLPLIGDLFEIRQGVRTGNKHVFILSVRQYEELDRKEKKFFRPAAGGGSIRNGKLSSLEYVYYPYATDGSLIFTSEEDLQKSLPIYYEKYLKPAKSDLASRTSLSGRNWWELSEKRAWQSMPAPRLFSTYFGGSGSFAFDEDGQYVSVNGHAWLWTKETSDFYKDTQVSFSQTPAVWAYLAILNSKKFEEIMSLFSLRLQGGQIRLERRFLSQIPLPDVTDEMSCPREVLSDLYDLGKAIHNGELKDITHDLDKCVSLLYGFEQR